MISWEEGGGKREERKAERSLCSGLVCLAKRLGYPLLYNKEK